MALNCPSLSQNLQICCGMGGSSVGIWSVFLLQGHLKVTVFFVSWYCWKAWVICAFASSLLDLFVSFCYLRPHLWHMEVARLGVKSELHIAVEPQLSEVKHWTLVFKDTSWVRFCPATMGSPSLLVWWGCIFVVVCLWGFFGGRVERFAIWHSSLSPWPRSFSVLLKT